MEHKCPMIYILVVRHYERRPHSLISLHRKLVMPTKEFKGKL